MIFILTFTAFANPWIWKIAGSNFLLFFLIILTVLVLHLSLTKRKYLLLAALLFLMMAFFQWKTTTFQSLVLLDNDEQRIRSIRLEFYKPSLHYTRVLFYRLDLKKFLEGDFTTASTRIQRIFFETIDPNIYFFGGHPRERVWANDFEKFTFIFIIPFLVGLYSLVSNKKRLVYFNLLIGIGLLSIIGHKNPFGPFILFPFFVVTISYGLITIFKKIHD